MRLACALAVMTLGLVLVLIPGAVLAGASAWASTPEGRRIMLHGNDHGALPCAACHGMRGQGKASTGAPALAGRPQAQIMAALARQAAGQGHDAVMASIARALSPAERKAVAAYFASLPKP